MNTQPIQTPTAVQTPVDPYDMKAWDAFYAANPDWRRGVGAEGVNDGEEADKAKSGEDGSEKPKDHDDKKHDGGEAGDVEKAKLSDKEAALLKDVMKNKERASKAEDALKAFEGIDVEEYKALKAAAAEQKAAKAKADEDAALARGEFDKVKAQMVEAHNAEMDKLKEQLTAKDAEIAKLSGNIEEMTIGASFANSKFISEETILSPRKARQLFGSHFEISEGAVVAYDKPAGAADRAPLVDANGAGLSFNEAMKKIVEADEDKDTLLKAKMKPGAHSQPPKGKAHDGSKSVRLSSTEKIAAGVGSLIESSQKPPL